MKKVFYLTGVFSIFLMGVSCKQKEQTPSSQINQIATNSFEESVAIFQQESQVVNSREKSMEVAATFEMVDFSGEQKLNNVYKIEDIEFCDNGLFNDVTANDGIYTSVQTFTPNKEKSLDNKIVVNCNEEFKFQNQLKSYLQSKVSREKTTASSGKPTATAEVGCKFYFAKCKNTTWYNTSWYGEPCIYFYDCEFKISLSV